MSLPAEARDALFKGFGRAFFKRDVKALYETVTSDFQWLTLDDDGNKRVITGREAVDAQLQKRNTELENIRFEDVIYHHAPDATSVDGEPTTASGRAMRPSSGSSSASQKNERTNATNGTRLLH